MLLTSLQHVKGYYELAYNRFVDIICASIHCELLTKCKNELCPSLKQHFRVFASEGMFYPKPGSHL